MRRTMLAVGLGVVFAACTGSAGPAGQNGTNGTNGMNGANGNDIILSERAKHGLDIAPVKLDLAGKDGPTIEKIGLGSYWVNAVADCGGCHTGSAGYLGGGVKFDIPPAVEAGDYVYTRNLTPDATGTMLSEADFITALTTGRDFNTGNEVLIIMPWVNYRWMHTDDLKAIYAYLKAIPAVANGNKADHKGAYAAATPVPLPTMYDRGKDTRAITPEKDYLGNPLPDPDGVIRGLEVNPMPNPAFTGTDATEEATFGRGAYLVNVATCNDCHTNPPYDPSYKVTTAAYLSGGAVFVTPAGLEPTFKTQRSMSANLVGKSGFFNRAGVTFTVFREALATGTHAELKTPTPIPLAWPMPWDKFRNMTTADQVALYTYMKATATQFSATVADKATQGAALWCDNANACPAAYTTCSQQAAPIGNECIGNACTDDAQCGACQHCDTAGTKKCKAPDPNNQADKACAAGAGI